MKFSSLRKEPFEFTGWHMLACMLAFFGVIIVVNFGMAMLASSTWTGLVVKNSYVASQKFNGELAAAKLQKSHGWKSGLAYKNGILTLRLEDRLGKPLNLQQPRLSIGRPAFEQQDRALDLAVRGNGLHAAAIDLAPGDWFVRIDGQLNGETYRRDARLHVGQDLSGELR